MRHVKRKENKTFIELFGATQMRLNFRLIWHLNLRKNIVNKTNCTNLKFRDIFLPYMTKSINGFVNGFSQVLWGSEHRAPKFRPVLYQPFAEYESTSTFEDLLLFVVIEIILLHRYLLFYWTQFNFLAA